MRPVSPDAVECWILHVIFSHSMRKIARARRVHASTVMRRVRRVEELCDDPVVERSLWELAPLCGPELTRQPRLRGCDIVKIAA